MQNELRGDAVASGLRVLSVTQLLRSVRDTLERRFPLAWVRGELSNLSRAPSGHCYFTLKDGQAQVDCVMFRSRAAALDWEPRDGVEVEVRALPTLYEPRGRFQLTVEGMRRAGLGPLYERFLKLKERLAAEGLFDERTKKEIPPHPRAIGVVTSLAAAALRDVLTTLARRNPAIPVIVYPAPVQGEGAADRMITMLKRAARRAECDVLLLVRGGGSIEDLWQFNEEALARAELLSQVADCARCLSREMQRKIQYAGQALDACARRLVHPAARLRSYQQLVTQLNARLAFAFSHKVHRCQARLAELGATLVSLDPAAVLGRGYSITYDASGAVVRDSNSVSAGERITTQLAQGRIDSEVKKS
jgi:exodeoxyribonuclease VII large subunit